MTNDSNNSIVRSHVKDLSPRELPIRKLSKVGTLHLDKDSMERILSMCRQVPETEWSGVIAIQKTGNHKNPTFKVKDVYFMSIDSTGATEFSWTEDEGLMDFMTDEVNMNRAMGTVHSHHNMNAFFSSIDMNEMMEKSYHAPYVMLIVHNRDPESWIAGVGYPGLITSKGNARQYVIDPITNKEVITKGEDEDLSKPCLFFHELNIEYAKTVKLPIDVEVGTRVEELRAKRSGSRNGSFRERNEFRNSAGQQEVPFREFENDTETEDEYYDRLGQEMGDERLLGQPHISINDWENGRS